ncbi:hypothetical protein [Latilactobacillus curvatus]|uniref:hypothetical protein n=1 Tax=Latilactobacillus curvatus TaxID=28038 RepID=UPI001C002C73|nr:hypothetical protein [Latilactobacillus curvatus]MCP8863865.1 hypothetical protein [Latilactobacillus curvatus]MCP8867340.1 hypothetical protein [Latilactobacillus curvatus]MCP8870881.1 hypothetical protein [Latilactobacillus curvatus]MDG2976433.1 hypothetical protein [Latilactobacillus curvatus]QWF36264.1 hypothetical protein KME73_03540 [Latilactobacillus curvatus]
MTHNLLKRNRILVLMLAIMVIILGITVKPTHASSVYGGQSEISFTVHIDHSKPTLPDVGVAQPDIPKNGQVIRYTPDGQATTTGRLPQTSVLKSPFLSLLGIAIILLVIMWRYQQRVRRETQDDAK